MNARLEANTAEAEAPDLDSSVGQIAVQFPGATAIFRRLKIDFCCGGQISLKQAASEKGLDADAVLTELMALRRGKNPTGVTDPVILIHHIVTRYHAVHRAQLPELIRMSRRVEAVHRENPLVPVGLADLLEIMERELLSHMGKEEEILFPMLQAERNPSINQPISMMRAEHVDHGAMLEKLARLTNDATPPVGACNTWRALYSGIAQFQCDLIDHIHLENNVLFAQFDARPIY